MSGKITVILLIIIISGCSVARQSVRQSDRAGRERTSGINIPEEQNLTDGNFDIDKAQIEIYSNGETKKMIAFVKYRIPGNYLLSIRSKTGIEAARIFVSADTVLINDRINRKLYTGSTRFLSEKYGITGKAIPLLFGDFIADIVTKPDSIKCRNGEWNVIRSIDGRKIIYIVDCRLLKPVSTVIYNDRADEGLKIEYKDFEKTGRKVIPEHISLEDLSGETRIAIKIIRIDFSKNDQVNFIPGNNYEKIVLK